MERDRKEMSPAPWWLHSSQATPHAAGTAVVMAGTAVIALPQGDISSITAGMEIFAGRPGRPRIRRCARLRRRPRA